MGPSPALQRLAPVHRWKTPLDIGHYVVVWRSKKAVRSLSLGLLDLKELLETGRIAPVVDRRFPSREAPDALRYIGKGHARGKPAVTVV